MAASLLVDRNGTATPRRVGAVVEEAATDVLDDVPGILVPGRLSDDFVASGGTRFIRVRSDREDRFGSDGGDVAGAEMTGAGAGDGGAFIFEAALPFVGLILARGACVGLSVGLGCVTWDGSTDVVGGGLSLALVTVDISIGGSDSSSAVVPVDISIGGSDPRLLGYVVGRVGSGTLRLLKSTALTAEGLPSVPPTREAG